MEKYVQVLKEKGFKITNQRMDVLEVLEENRKEHLSTEDVFAKLIEKGKDIGIATVYRTLQMLEESGLVYKLDLDGKSYRYELADYPEKGKMHQHHHLICENCHAILEVQGDFLDELEQMIEEKCKFKVMNHDVKFYGLCEHCKK